MSANSSNGGSNGNGSLRAYQVRVNGNEVLPLKGRAVWMDQHGPIASEIPVTLRASLVAWERFGARIRHDGSIELGDKVLLRMLQNILCHELRREPKSVTRDQDESEALLERAKFAAACELGPMPKDSFPKPGENYEAKTTPWFLPGDDRLSWLVKGQPCQFGLRVVYAPPGVLGVGPEVERVDGPFPLDQYEMLPQLPADRYGRLLLRVLGAD